MATVTPKNPITPCLWFDTQAQEAAEYYTSVFPNSRITQVTHYTEAGPRPAGLVMTVAFELDGHPFLALNGGPDFAFTEAVSFQVGCDTQEEVDEFWKRLSDGGEEGQCGWVKDRFGLSRQIVPSGLERLLSTADGPAGERFMAALMKMGKLDLAELERAAAGS